jgi:uncharacterized DUF497 family protein/predicted DNA binding CopG/RHH family protein
MAEDPREELSRCEGFNWDDANAPKIWERHEVSPGETEQVFFNHPLVAVVDSKHSDTESRFLALGQTDSGRRLFVVFTIRGRHIRVISARDMSRRDDGSTNVPNKRKRQVPVHRSEEKEREFWATADSTEYVDWSHAKRVALPHLRPSTKTISLRLPEGLLADLKVLANKQDIPYQSLLKIYLAERIQQEFGKIRQAG